MSSSQPNDSSGIDLIDEACREEFEVAWLTGERKSIAECLPEPGSESYRPTLEELVCIQIELQWKAVSRARSCSTMAGNSETMSMQPVLVEQYVEEFQDLVEPDIQERLIRHEFLIRGRIGDHPRPDDYRERFPELDIETVLSAAAQNTVLYETTTETHDNSSALPDSPPGYELLERIGDGGMGIVYRARQLAADRIVALKVIRADRLEHVSAAARTDILERFRIEAQATARLDHPHVVGIFEVNTSNPAQPWFSMQLVAGRSLAEHLANGPVGCREAAEFSHQIADAVAAAHQHGVLHRDLKPHNVFLRPDEKHVLVGDFGLAKFDVDDVQRTSQDDILGTPAYMSPEQIRNSAGVGVATDIWSIGATLYHLLTGRPPFQAASAMQTLQHVLEHEPTSPRTLNPEVDRDLETICLKCLQKNPQHRYSSANLLADDLSLYLNGSPISARPISRVEHVYRWCRRNPLAAGLATLALAGVVIAIVGLSIGYRTATDALAESNASHLLARQTVNDLFTEVSETVLLEKPGMQPLRQRLLERALNYYRKFVETGRDSQELRAEMGDVWFRIGRIEKELGRPEESGKALQQALIIQHGLVDESPTIPNREALSSTYNAIGSLHLAQRRWDDAANALLRALDLRAALVDESPSVAELKRLYANTIMNLGAVHRNRLELIDALNRFREASGLQRELLAAAALDSETARLVRRDFGMALFNSANAAFDIESTDINTEVLPPLEEAISLFQALLKEQPDSYTDRRRLVLCRQVQAEAHRGTIAAADAAVEAANEMQQLVAGNPAVPELVRECVQLQLLSGRLYGECGRHKASLFWFDGVVKLLTERPEKIYGDSPRDLAVATAEAALVAVQITAPDAVERLTEGKEVLQRTLAESAGDQEIAKLLREVVSVLASVEE